MMRPRSLLLAAALCVAGALPAAAQFPRPMATATPNTWTTLSVGYLDLGQVYEGESGATWQIGGTPVFRATLEQSTSRGAAIGASLSYANLPMTYYGTACNGCNADGKLWQALGHFRIGGGSRLHQVIELTGGVTSVQDITERNGGKIGGDPVIAPTVGLGYGLAYPFSPRSQFVLMQEFGLMFFKRGDLPAGSNENHPRTQVTRIGLRLGLGK